MRGLDEDGNVANYVETEQILIHGGYCTSFVQVGPIIHSHQYIKILLMCPSVRV